GLRAEPRRGPARPEAHVPARRGAGAPAPDQRRTDEILLAPAAGAGSLRRSARIGEPMSAPQAARRFDLLVFDWDGTLIDSAPTIVACIQSACRDLGLPVPDEARASHVIGLGLHDALVHAVPGLPASEYGRVAERYRHHFLERD